MTTTTQPSPFFITDDQATASPYWEARHELADAMRKLNALVVTSDLSESDCQDITREVAALTHRLSARDQYPGIVAWSKAKKFGDMPRINYEVLSIGGRSHPGAPGMKMRREGDDTIGTVTFDGAFEGPPGCVHGGWVAALFDQFMGMVHMVGGNPGMTGGLSVRYVKPTPLYTELTLVGHHEVVSERRTKVTGEMLANGEVTATCEAMFVRAPTAFLMESFGLSAD